MQVEPIDYATGIIEGLYTLAIDEAATNVEKEFEALKIDLLQDEVKTELLKRRHEARHEYNETPEFLRIVFFGESQKPIAAKKRLATYLSDRIEKGAMLSPASFITGQIHYETGLSIDEVVERFTSALLAPLYTYFKALAYTKKLEPTKATQPAHPNEKPEHTLRQVALILVYNGETFISADHVASREKLNKFAAKYGHKSDTSGVQLYKKHFKKLTTPTNRTGVANPRKMIKDIEAILHLLTPAGKELAETDLAKLSLLSN